MPNKYSTFPEFNFSPRSPHFVVDSCVSGEKTPTITTANMKTAAIYRLSLLNTTRTYLLISCNDNKHLGCLLVCSITPGVEARDVLL